MTADQIAAKLNAFRIDAPYYSADATNFILSLVGQPEYARRDHIIPDPPTRLSNSFFKDDWSWAEWDDNAAYSIHEALCHLSAPCMLRTNKQLAFTTPAVKLLTKVIFQHLPVSHNCPVLQRFSLQS